MSYYEKLEALVKMLDSLPEGEYITISKLSNNTQMFIDAVKYLIHYNNKPYEFSNDYTKIRRLDPM